MISQYRYFFTPNLCNMKMIKRVLKGIQYVFNVLIEYLCHFDYYEQKSEFQLLIYQ